ncbi:citrate lyase acyl carrier protein [Clostridium tarantellae]|uniref:Citrate lyase acyl carrier protein n=1 Tax=Clostridium tarantellae TaxID=39493 RepID=A0A6I1MLD0_9CLOT|nr:citrate lyase acyl carrier protein [Clostridium tarantellae]MPQ43820.1 citrate lyase acyl carrier protein [Clostridium tarantellae]
MEIKKSAMAGTLESSDICIVIEPNNSGIAIELNSTVEKQFGKQIKKVIMDTLKALDIDNVIVRANDKGALDCVIKARVETAVFRGAEISKIDWRGLNNVQA